MNLKLEMMMKMMITDIEDGGFQSSAVLKISRDQLRYKQEPIITPSPSPTSSVTLLPVACKSLFEENEFIPEVQILKRFLHKINKRINNM